MQFEEVNGIRSVDKPICYLEISFGLLSSQGAEPSTGYVDVAFEITKFGKSRRIEVLDTPMNASPEAEKELVRAIKETTFRPRVVNGQFVDTSRVTARYEWSE